MHQHLRPSSEPPSTPASPETPILDLRIARQIDSRARRRRHPNHEVAVVVETLNGIRITLSMASTFTRPTQSPAIPTESRAEHSRKPCRNPVHLVRDQLTAIGYAPTSPTYPTMDCRSPAPAHPRASCATAKLNKSASPENNRQRPRRRPRCQERAHHRAYRRGYLQKHPNAHIRVSSRTYAAAAPTSRNHRDQRRPIAYRMSTWNTSVSSGISTPRRPDQSEHPGARDERPTNTSPVTKAAASARLFHGLASHP